MRLDRGVSHDISPRSGGFSARERTEDVYLSLRALAKYADLSIRTLRGYLVRGASPLPHYRIGGKILVKRSEFDAWMRQHRVRQPLPADDVVADLLRTL